MRVHVACVAPGCEFLVHVDVDDGSTVADALHVAAVAARTGSVPDPAGLAIFGQPVTLTTPLRDGDRVEVTRPLVVDPKTARRARAVRAAPNAPNGRSRRTSGR